MPSAFATVQFIFDYEEESIMFDCVFRYKCCTSRRTNSARSWLRKDDYGLVTFRRISVIIRRRI